MEKPSHDKIKAVAHEASLAFWDVVKNSFPEVKTGDMDPIRVTQWQLRTEIVVQEWINNNWPEKKEGSCS
jgi:hypothetical protein